MTSRKERLAQQRKEDPSKFRSFTPKPKKTIYLKRKKAIRLKKKTGISAYREKKTLGGRAVKVMTSLKTTAVLGGILGTLLAPATALRYAKTGLGYVAKGTLGSPKKILLTTTAIGALGASPKLRGMVARRIKDPFGHGRALGEIVEDPSKLLPKEGETTKEKIIELGKKAGLIGAGAGIITAGVVGAKKIIEKRREATLGLGATPQETLGLATPLGMAGQIPILPETTDITEKPVQKRAYKPRRATKTPSVRQYVRVDIINRPVTTGIRVTNKRYLKQELLN